MPKEANMFRNRYELRCPPLRQWPAIWKARFLWLYDISMDKVLPWKWMLSAVFLPKTPAHRALKDMVVAAWASGTDAA
jgi:hypothetical protein